MIKRGITLCVLLLALLTLVSGCSKSPARSGTANPSPKKGVELTISAAASMQDALDAIKKVYEKHSSNTILINYGSSGTLQHQIEQGAPVDLFFSASTKQMDALRKEGLMDPSYTKNLLKNDLVLIVPNSSKSQIHSLGDLARSSVSKISIGTPETVPAGNYAKESLVNQNVWNSVKDKVVYGKDVRQVLDYVETGNVDAGIVYRTDALISKKSKIASTISDSSHSPIIYPIGILKASKHKKEIEDFYKFLESNQAKTIFEKYGFKMANQGS